MMARRIVQLTTRTAVPKMVSQRANFNEIKVEIRVIFPPTAKWWEVLPLINDAEHEARERLVREHPGGGS